MVGLPRDEPASIRAKWAHGMLPHQLPANAVLLGARVGWTVSSPNPCPLRPQKMTLLENWRDNDLMISRQHHLGFRVPRMPSL